MIKVACAKQTHRYWSQTDKKETKSNLQNIQNLGQSYIALNLKAIPKSVFLVHVLQQGVTAIKLEIPKVIQKGKQHCVRVALGLELEMSHP
jgi:hypothetical protein